MATFNFPKAVNGALRHATEFSRIGIISDEVEQPLRGNDLLDNLEVAATSPISFVIHFSGAHAASEARFISSMLTKAGAKAVERTAINNGLGRKIEFIIPDTQQENVATSFNHIAEGLVAKTQVMKRIQMASTSIDQTNDGKLIVGVTPPDAKGEIGFSLNLYTINARLTEDMVRAGFASIPVEEFQTTACSKIKGGRMFTIPTDRMEQAVAIFELLVPTFYEQKIPQGNADKTEQIEYKPGGVRDVTAFGTHPDKQSPAINY